MAYLMKCRTMYKYLSSFLKVLLLVRRQIFFVFIHQRFPVVHPLINRIHQVIHLFHFVLGIYQLDGRENKHANYYNVGG